MTNRSISLLCAGALLASLPSAASAATKVDVRVEGAKKTLVAGRAVTLGTAPVVKDGDPAHACRATSAAGALETATAGDWKATWSDGLGYFASAIRGEAPQGSDFFSLWVNHRLSSTGLCDTALKAGDHVLLFVDKCAKFDAATQACADALAPLGISVASKVRKGRNLVVRVVAYGPDGKKTPQKGAAVYANGSRVKGVTDARGVFRVTATRTGKVSFYATRAGRVRSEVAVTRVTKA